MGENLNKIDFNQGTLNFWIPEGKINYGDNKFLRIFYHATKNGKIKIIKDKDNGLKVYYLFEDNKAFLNTKADDLEDDDKHMITITWSLPERKIKLYIDAELRDEKEIDVVPSQFHGACFVPTY